MRIRKLEIRLLGREDGKSSKEHKIHMGYCEKG